jgi:hypothetical protein
MKALIVLALALATSGMAMAQQARIPTGVEVRGCAGYKLLDGKVIEQCNRLEGKTGTPPVDHERIWEPKSGGEDKSGNAKGD